MIANIVWRKWLARWKAPGRPAVRRLGVVCLEDRVVPAVTVQFGSSQESVNPATGTFDIPVTLADDSPSVFASGFQIPSGLTFDAAGTLYVADPLNDQVDKVSADGTVTPFATGLPNPNSLAFDAAGNLYVTVTNGMDGGAVDKVSADGTVTTFVTGLNNLTGLSTLGGLAFDAGGNLYVADSSDNTVRMVSPAGMVTTFATGLAGPAGLAFDAAGTLYVSEFGNGKVDKIEGGTPTPFATGFNGPSGLAFGPDGTLYVSEYNGTEVDRLAASGTFTPFATGVNSPQGLAFDAAGSMYIAESYVDPANGLTQIGTINKVTLPAQSVPFTLGGTATSGVDYTGVTASPLTFAAGQTKADITGTLIPHPGNPLTLTLTLGTPSDSVLGPRATNNLNIAYRPEVQFVAGGETVNAAAGTFSIPVTLTGSPAPALTSFASGLSQPYALAFSPAGDLYVSLNIGSVDKLSADGIPTTYLTGVGGEDPITFDPAGNLYIGEVTKVVKVAADTNRTTFATGFGDVQGLAFGPDGNLYVADLSNGVVDSVAADGTVTLAAAGLGNPSGLAFGSDGTLYIAEELNGKISKLGTDGQITTVATGLNQPYGLAADSTGTLYVSERNNGTVDKVTADGTVTQVATGLDGGNVGLAVAPSGTLYIADILAVLKLQTPPVTVSFTVGGTAVPGVDYTGLTTGPLVFAPGQTTAVITGTLVPNTGGPKTLTFTLGTPTYAVRGPVNANTLTITEPTPTLGGISPSTAIAGSSSVIVTLIGTGFTSGSTATFDGTPVATAYLSPSELTAIIPAADLVAAGPEPITVITPGQPTTAAQTFSVTTPTTPPTPPPTLPPAPTVTGIAPASGPTTGGSAVTITGTDLGSVLTVTFGGVSATIVSDSATQIVVTDPAEASGTVDVLVQTAGGISTATSADHFAYAASPPVTPPSPPVTPPSPPVTPPSPPVTPPSPPVVPPSPPVSTSLTGPAQFAVGVGAGSSGVVTVYNPDGSVDYTVVPFGSSYTGGVRIALADLTGDGVPDVIAGTGPGVTNQLVILDGKTHDQMLSFYPFETSFTGGIFVATGDLSGDGVPDLTITPDQTGGPVVAVYDGSSLGRGHESQLARFFGIQDPNFRGGARAAVGDVNDDGVADLIVTPGVGGGPRVAIYDGKSVTRNAPVKLVADFFAFESTLRTGIYVAAGDLTGKGYADLIFGGGVGSGPRVVAIDPKPLLAGTPGPLLASFFAGNPNDRNGARVAVANLDGDAKADVVVGFGTANVTGYTATAIAANPDNPVPDSDLENLANVTAGVFVG